MHLKNIFFGIIQLLAVIVCLVVLYQKTGRLYVIVLAMVVVLAIYFFNIYVSFNLHIWKSDIYIQFGGDRFLNKSKAIETSKILDTSQYLTVNPEQ